MNGCRARVTIKEPPGFGFIRELGSQEKSIKGLSEPIYPMSAVRVEGPVDLLQS